MDDIDRAREHPSEKGKASYPPVIASKPEGVALGQERSVPRRVARQQIRLLETARYLTETLDATEVLRRIGVAAKEILDAYGCAIYLLDVDGRTLSPVVSIEPDYAEEILSAPLDVETSFTGQAVLDRRGLIFNDAGTSIIGQHIPGTPVEEDERVIVTPFITDSDVLGAMCLNRMGKHFTDDDLALAETFATYAAIALRNAQAHEALRNEVEERRQAEETLRESEVRFRRLAQENARLLAQARRDADARSVLLNEVNHRVKNNLSAIVGLLFAERRRAGEEESPAYQTLVRDMINRVEGLATVHRLLSASSWELVQLNDLVSQVVQSSLRVLPRDRHVSVDVAFSTVRVTPDQAHNLALVINELTTNTVKYASVGNDAVEITVRINSCDTDGRRQVELEFRDDGPGYPDDVLRMERCGVGLELTRNIVGRSLGGKLALRNDHGAVAVICFDAEATGA